MTALLSILKNLHRATVLVVGDVMLDNYVYGTVDRISPEAPIPILKIQRNNEMLGGAGNVVANLHALGVQCFVVGVCGKDENGIKLRRLLAGLDRVEHHMLSVDDMATVTKTRYVSGSQQVLRTDIETPSAILSERSGDIFALVSGAIDRCDVVILSDYKKGVITPALCQSIISLARDRGIPVFVDPKGRDYSTYRQATLIKPNLKELKDAFGYEDITGREVDYARRLLAKYDIEYCLLTVGKEGMKLISRDHEISFSSARREVFDVSGAGDAVIATVAAAQAAGASLEDACYLSNLAGGIAVTKPGTSPVSNFELVTELKARNKIFTLPELMLQVEAWRANGSCVGFTNGCFDLLHAGHIQTLDYARKNCDKLIVAINSDSSVKRLKGEDRPINSEDQRLTVMAALESIDALILFSDDTPETIIEWIQPNVLVKGADYALADVVGKKCVEASGGKLLLAPVVEDLSTTRVIRRIQATLEKEKLHPVA
ncbi:D-beta-D-heptose 7-phosphate kinase / D-beta-D-heptose 1-phosphate adenosyltransferase [Chryseolinea serpens]|uniref:Bifunctional protein HldE n=1 Tax=Chryseolinea serpens TaxID=947013 RepID=A0A1M5XUT4_9BACT|nr:D-glycero-beta-D-manno-heptose-7-phosphate kinase [Chryseolinea serpens]SHI03314.1 D-beta-D-heptose 7-phosphate kinase / D-beta-D-heptose 1-phosphate adenosyltransferase [Chryseolinea serpens]